MPDAYQRFSLAPSSSQVLALIPLLPCRDRKEPPCDPKGNRAARPQRSSLPRSQPSEDDGGCPGRATAELAVRFGFGIPDPIGQSLNVRRQAALSRGAVTRNYSS